MRPVSSRRREPKWPWVVLSGAYRKSLGPIRLPLRYVTWGSSRGRGQLDRTVRHNRMLPPVCKITGRPGRQNGNPILEIKELKIAKANLSEEFLRTTAGRMGIDSSLVSNCKRIAA